MVFLIALHLIVTYSFLAPAEAMVGSAYSMVRREADNVPLCAIDQSSAVKSTVSAMWCGIECITSSSSTCDAFSYFETTNKCDIFFFSPDNYTVADDCATYTVIVSVAINTIMYIDKFHHPCACSSDPIELETSRKMFQYMRSHDGLKSICWTRSYTTSHCLS